MAQQTRKVPGSDEVGCGLCPAALCSALLIAALQFFDPPSLCQEEEGHAVDVKG